MMTKERDFDIGGEIQITGTEMPGADGQPELQKITFVTAFFGGLGDSLQLDLGQFKDSEGRTLCDVLHGDHYCKILSLVAAQDKEGQF